MKFLHGVYDKGPAQGRQGWIKDRPSRAASRSPITRLRLQGSVFQVRHQGAHSRQVFHLGTICWEYGGILDTSGLIVHQMWRTWLINSMLTWKRDCLHHPRWLRWLLRWLPPGFFPFEVLLGKLWNLAPPCINALLNAILASARVNSLAK